MNPDIVLVRLPFVADLLQDLGEEVEELTEPVEILDRSRGLEVEFVHSGRKLAEHALVRLHRHVDSRLGVDKAADPLIVEEPLHAPGFIALDHKVPIKSWMADLDVLHAERLAQIAEERCPVDLEPEALRVEIGGAEPRVRGARVRVGQCVERDDPVVGSDLNGQGPENAPVEDLAVHLARQLPPDFLAAWPEQGFEGAHWASFRSVIAIVPPGA